VHEYVFGIAAGRVLGFAMAFFLIQGVAVAAMVGVRPSGSQRRLGIAVTFVFNLCSAWLIFACVNAVLPVYSAR
jgi:hypothetical protein